MRKTSYVDVALGEIRQDYPKAYEILKDAIPEEYEPFIEEVCIGADGVTLRNGFKNRGGILTLSHTDAKALYAPDEQGYCSGVLKLGLNTYKLENTVLTDNKKHKLTFAIEKVEVV